MRRSPQKAGALEGIARRLGRRLVKRGKHPMWESTEFAGLFALSIPRHGDKDLATGTRNSILDQLEDDILTWDEKLTLEEREEQDGDGNGTG